MIAALLLAAAVQCHVGFDSHGVAYPDHAPGCTPGDTVAVTKAALCTKGYTKTVRNVPESEKRDVFARYGIKAHRAGQYEVDHLISLELGGSNSPLNLWPEASAPQPGYHQKDVCENKAHSAVCSGAITLEAAQDGIATDWLTFCRGIGAVK
jgi:hypothetical protein